MIQQNGALIAIKELGSGIYHYFYMPVYENQLPKQDEFKLIVDYALNKVDIESIDKIYYLKTSDERKTLSDVEVLSGLSNWRTVKYSKDPNFMQYRFTFDSYLAKEMYQQLLFTHEEKKNALLQKTLEIRE